MRRLLLSAFCCLLLEPALIAADTWIEVKSPHFTVISNAGEGSTRRLVWQLEQSGARWRPSGHGRAWT